MADILPVLGVEPEYSEEEEALVDKTVPRVIGKTLAEAQAAMTEQGFTYRVVGDGATVTAQLPRSNSTVAAGSEVVLYCGVDADTDTVTMIDLSDLDYDTARIRMGWAGLYIKVDGSLMSGSSALIKKQSLEAGTEIPVGTVVTVSMSDSSNLGRY
jgi:stage V sporulation protein D (sporulation-specific penicillin-binding protein)